MTLCNIVKELITKTWFIIDKHKTYIRDKHTKSYNNWDKHTVLFCLLQHEKIWTNRTYMHRSRYATHGLGYLDLIYHKWQRYGHINPTKRHCLKSTHSPNPSPPPHHHPFIKGTMTFSKNDCNGAMENFN